MKRSLTAFNVIIACWVGVASFANAQQVIVTRAYTVQSGDIEQVAAELRGALKDHASVTVDSSSKQLLVAAETYVHTELQRALFSGTSNSQDTPTNVFTQPLPDLPHNHTTMQLPSATATPPPTGAGLISDPSGGFVLDNPIHVAQLPTNGPQDLVDTPIENSQLEIRPQREIAQAPQTSPIDPGTNPSQQAFTLQNASPRQVTQTIQRLLENQSKTTTAGDISTISAMGRDGQPVQFEINNNTGQVILRGNVAARQAWQRVLTAIDRPPNTNDDQTQLVSVTGRKPQAVQRALQLIREQNAAAGTREAPPRQAVIQWTDGLFRQQGDVRVAQNQSSEQAPPAEAPAPAVPPALGADEPAEQMRGLLGSVQIVYLDGLDVIVLRGNPQDVERVQAIIDEIESLSAVTEPAIEVYELKHANSQAMAELVNPLYEQVLSPRQGAVSITPLVQPNSILMVGRADSVRVVRELVAKLDQPTAPDAQFYVFRLKNMDAAAAGTTITSFYEERGGLGTRVRVTSDARSNSIILQAGPRDAAEVSKLLEGMDIESSATEQSMRVFKLRFSLAEELGPILQAALQGQAAAPGADAAAATSARATALSLLTVDAKGQRLLKSGILSNVTVTADTQSNAIIVRGPENSMALIEALITQLDERPSEDAEVKVFTIVNGDALLLADVLNQLFGNQLGGGGGGGFQGGQNQQQGGENPLIPLRFSVDERTNSIVATGSLQDLRVVEAILLRLDEKDASTRRNVVYRLRYAPAIDVAAAINQFLTNERSISDVAPNKITPLQQIEREVVVVPELVSNSLIVSATPQYYDEIYEIVQKLDERPPMVMIQLLIAEVDLQNFAEFGVELGLQDSLLFDRGVFTTAADQTTTQVSPGFNFNNQTLGNGNVSPGSAAGQGLTNFALSRVNDQLGFGGLVLSVSSDSISMLLRALEQESRLQILSRPQIMTMDNQSAFVQIGSRVPRIVSTQLTQFGTINNTQLEDVGIVFGVRPRISPDGLVVMEIDAEKSELGSITSGIPIAISQSGDVIFSPIINTKTAQATIAARNGQTVVFGGLISETDDTRSRRVPYLSDIPLIGDLFKYDRHDRKRSELLFILTPHIIRGDQDVHCVNQAETERMSWCLSDAYRVHGYFDVNACEGGMGMNEQGIMEICPDQSPSSADFLQSEPEFGTYESTGDVYQPPYNNPLTTPQPVDSQFSQPSRSESTLPGAAANSSDLFSSPATLPPTSGPRSP